MTLDEAIIHAEEVAEENYGKAIAYLSEREVYKHEEQKCIKCADEHMQLAEWLKDYKRLKEQEPKTVLYSGDGYADGYMVYDMAECPSCGYEYEDGDKDWGLSFCPNCGQKLNWERNE